MPVGTQLLGSVPHKGHAKSYIHHWVLKQDTIGSSKLSFVDGARKQRMEHPRVKPVHCSEHLVRKHDPNFDHVHGGGLCGSFLGLVQGRAVARHSKVQKKSCLGHHQVSFGNDSLRSGRSECRVLGKTHSCFFNPTDKLN